MWNYSIYSAASFCKAASSPLGPQRKTITNSISGNTNHLSSCFSPNSGDDFTVRQHSQASFNATSLAMSWKMVSIPLIQKHLIQINQLFIWGAVVPQRNLINSTSRLYKRQQRICFVSCQTENKLKWKHNCFRGRYSDNYIFFLRSISHKFDKVGSSAFK